MIKLGVLKLKKNEVCLLAKKCVLICAICLSMFTGCKTTSQFLTQLNPVKTVDILDDQGAMYVHIPVDENKDLFEKFILAFFQNMDEDDVQMIISKVDNVYASFGSINDKSRVQIALDGTIPFLTGALLKKNGFTEKTYSAASLYSTSTESAATYKYYEANGIQIAIPSMTQMIICKDVSTMLDTYNCEKEAANALTEEQIAVTSNYRQDWKTTDLYDWINTNDTAINFYIVRPQSFLSKLIGSNISSSIFRLNYTKGKFEKITNTINYELTLDLEFANNRFVKPALSLLTLSLNLADIELKQISSTHLQLSGVHLNMDQLTNMLGI